jgi:hypothetical protein
LGLIVNWDPDGSTSANNNLNTADQKEARAPACVVYIIVNEGAS